MPARPVSRANITPVGLKTALSYGPIGSAGHFVVHIAIHNMVDRCRGARTERDTQIAKHQYLL